MSDQISEGPACQTKYANSARPIAAKAIPAGARLLVVPSAFTFSAITNFVRPRGPLGFFVGATKIRQQRPPPQMPARRRAQTQTNRVPRAALCADSASFQAKARRGSPSGRGAFAACDGRLLHAAPTPEQLFRRAARVCDTIMAARPPGRAIGRGGCKLRRISGVFGNRQEPIFERIKAIRSSRHRRSR